MGTIPEPEPLKKWVVTFWSNNILTLLYQSPKMDYLWQLRRPMDGPNKPPRDHQNKALSCRWVTVASGVSASAQVYCSSYFDQVDPSELIRLAVMWSSQSFRSPLVYPASCYVLCLRTFWPEVFVFVYFGIVWQILKDLF